MIKRYKNNYTNESNGVAMIVRSAQKRRVMALSAAKSINSETGLGNKLVAIK